MDLRKPTDLRLNSNYGFVAIDFEGDVAQYFKEDPKTFQLQLPEHKRVIIVDDKTERNFGQIQPTEPHNFIYP